MSTPPACITPGCPRPPRLQGGRECSLHQYRRQRGLPVHAPHDVVGVAASGFGLFGIVDRDEHGVMCHDCGRWFGALVQHLRQAHAVTVAEYRDRHGLPPGVPLTSLATSRTITANSHQWIGTPGWERFVQRRDETLPQTQQLAAAASAAPNAGTSALRARNARSRPADGRWGGQYDDERWGQQWAQVLAWREQHAGHWPSRVSGSTEDRALGRWLKQQREAHRLGTLRADRTAVLIAAGFNLAPGQGVRR